MDTDNTATNTTTVNCPECYSKMHKMGKAWSGRKQVQRYRCPKCGRTYAPVNKDNALQISTDEGGDDK